MEQLDQARQAADMVMELSLGIEETDGDNEFVGKIVAREAVAIDRIVAALENLELRVRALEEK